MWVTSTMEQEIVHDARRDTRDAMLWAVGLVGLLALIVAAAVRGLDGVPSAALWFLAGVATAAVLTAMNRAWQAWAEERAIRRCPTCLGAAVDLAAADRRWSECTDARHVPGVR